MSLKIGIVGLPNVGKSTLFNAITNSQVKTANYPFATINPNIGTVEVPNKIMDKLIDIMNPNKIVNATFEFYDIAGLISGASKGEGLGNAFLANIKNTDAICMVVRCFENKNITHVKGNVDPIRDVEIINLELIISDQEQIKKRIEKISKITQKLKQKNDILEYKLLLKLEKQLNENKLLKDLTLTKNEIKQIKNFNLLTIKPFIYVANINEDSLNLANKKNEYVNKLQEYAKQHKIEVVSICAQIEQELSNLSKEDKVIFMREYNIAESGLEQLIKKSYILLGLQTFFTAGKQEVHAWTFKKGMTASECARIIHTDFEKGFIKVEIYSYDDLIQYDNEKAIKKNGKIRSEGKTYLMQDGDICFFKINI